MTELDEITTGKSLDQLKVELKFQMETMGESLGGAICAHISHQIELATPEKIVVRSLGHLFETYVLKSEDEANKFMKKNKDYGLLLFSENCFYVASCEDVKETDSMEIIEIEDLINELMEEK